MMVDAAPATRRLFFALWPDEALRQQIEAAAFPRLARNTTPPAHWHITLLFLGPTVASQQLELERAAGTVRASPFDLRLDTTGCFERAGIGYLGCREQNRALLRFQGALENALHLACPNHTAFARKGRAYTPHLTLYRHMHKYPVVPLDTPVNWRVSSFSLIETRRDKSPVYRVLNRWDLSV